MPNIPVTVEIKNLLDADNLTQSKAALGVLGAAVWNFVGAYASGAPYAVGDVVTYQGQTWYRLNANGGNVGDTPAEGAFWTILAQAGVNGGTGTGAGDVVGPSTSVANRVSTFSDTTGNVIQSSPVSISNAGAITTPPSTASVIPFYYDTLADFPLAATANHGAIAHAHDTGAMYYSHSNAWVKMLDTGTPVTVAQGGTGVSTLLTGVSSLLASTTSAQSKTALTTLGVGTAGFVNTGISAGTLPVLLPPTIVGGNAKLPVLDGSNLTGLPEVAELRPTTFILNDLGNTIAQNNTLAYSGDFLSRHNNTIAGGKILTNTESVISYAQLIKNKTIFRKKLSRQPNGDLRPIKLNIKVRGPTKVGGLELGLLQVYACYVDPNATLPDTGLLSDFSLNRYDLFNNSNTVGDAFFVPTDNTVQQMNYDIDAMITSTSGYESTATKLTYSTAPDPFGGPDNIAGSVETRTIHSIFTPMAGFYPIIPITAGATFDDLVIQATIFSRDRVHVGPTFSTGSGMVYNGALWYDTTANQLKLFNTEFEFAQYKINNVVVPTYYSATEAGATIPTYVAGKYIFFGDKDYYKKGEGGVYVTKYNYLYDSLDLIAFETSINFITE